MKDNYMYFCVKHITLIVGFPLWNIIALWSASKDTFIHGFGLALFCWQNKTALQTSQFLFAVLLLGVKGAIAEIEDLV